jgi:hypothetical protein
MQILEHYDPLNLPRGSVRSLIALALLGVLWSLMLLDREIPLPLTYLVLLVLGYYFGSRSTQVRVEGQRSPLFLPRGTIRAVIVAGFAAVAYRLASTDRLSVVKDGSFHFNVEDRRAVILFLVAALVLGVVVKKAADVVLRGKTTPSSKLLSNIRAVVALMATAILAIVSCLTQEEPLNLNLALAATLIVGFYFGSRR